MDRRDAIHLLGAIAAVPFLPRSVEAASRVAGRVHRAVQGGAGFRTFDADQQALVGRLADAILPATDTPGALEVRVPQFIDRVVSDWASPGERRVFLDGLTDIEDRARSAGAMSFMALSPARQAALLETLDGERSAVRGAGHSFGLIKSLTVFGYFTSEVVQRDVLKTPMFFAAYEPCAPA